MTEPGASVSKTRENISQLRCIECGAVRENGGRNFRCASCGGLLEIVYPGLERLDPATHKSIWLQRRTSRLPMNDSGVWRFRELLSTLRDWKTAIALKETNTPLYELSSCASAAGMRQLRAKPQ